MVYVEYKKKFYLQLLRISIVTL
uniref:Uncharacterized protein n=1 Tax=Anguilla anguilla TaxID=7936 RepID=A0A0E9XYD4_ANGAN